MVVMATQEKLDKPYGFIGVHVGKISVIVAVSHY